MEFKEVLERRRTIRDFSDRDVTPDIIMNAIENGFKAPSYNHLRDWEFVVIRSSATKIMLIDSEELGKPVDMGELNRIFENEEAVKKEMYLDAIPKQKKMILTAPVVVAVIFKPKTRVEEARRVYDLNCLASVWACIENFLLSLAEQDVFGVTYIPQNTASVKEKLGVPGEYEIAALIPVGYKADSAKALRQIDIDVQKRIHYERWD